MKFTLDLGDIFLANSILSYPFGGVFLLVFSASKLRKQIKFELQKN